MNVSINSPFIVLIEERFHDEFVNMETGELMRVYNRVALDADGKAWRFYAWISGDGSEQYRNVEEVTAVPSNITSR